MAWTRIGRPILAETPRWLRGPARHEDGWIVLEARRAEDYYPFESTTLVFDLAAVTTPEDAVKAASRHGLLKHGDRAGDLRERFDDWVTEAAELRWLLRLNKALRRAVKGDGRAVERLWEMEPDFRPYFEDPAKSDEELLGQASLAISWLVSDGLADVGERLVAAVEMEDEPGSGAAGPPGDFRISALAKSLIGYAYHQLLLMIVNQAPMRECDECARFYVIEDHRQRFCTPTCANRVRYRRWSDKNRRGSKAQGESA